MEKVSFVTLDTLVEEVSSIDILVIGLQTEVPVNT